MFESRVIVYIQSGSEAVTMRGTRNLRKRGTVFMFFPLKDSWWVHLGWGCTSFWVTSFLARQFVDAVHSNNFSIIFFEPLLYPNQRDLFKKKKYLSFP